MLEKKSKIDNIMETMFDFSSLSEEERAQFSEEFLARMIELSAKHGRSKYGSIKEWIEEHDDYDHINALELRLYRYLIERDPKLLVDIANYAMFEYMYPIRR